MDVKTPASGGSETMTVDGTEYHFCSHCKLGKVKKPMWFLCCKAHTAADCRSKKTPGQRQLGGTDNVFTSLVLVQELAAAKPTDEQINGPLCFLSAHAYCSYTGRLQIIKSH